MTNQTTQTTRAIETGAVADAIDLLAQTMNNDTPLTATDVAQMLRDRMDGHGRAMFFHGMLPDALNDTRLSDATRWISDAANIAAVLTEDEIDAVQRFVTMLHTIKTA